jgi:uncharacterized protein YbcV (DUF1398 family)
VLFEETNSQGYFSIKEVIPGDYILNITHMSYKPVSIKIFNLNKSQNLGILSLDENSITLNEIIVEGTGSIYKIDRQILFPNKDQINTSTNGIELLHRMQIHGVDIDRMNNTIKSQKGGGVSLRINGAPANTKDFQAILPEDILRIEFHDFPSLRYGEVDYVIDYIVKRKETGGSLIASTRNSLHVKWGDEFLSLKLNHKNSQWTARGSYSYRLYDEVYQNSKDKFIFRNNAYVERIEKGLPTVSKNHNFDGAIGYSYKKNKDFLTATISYELYNLPVNESNSNIIYLNTNGTTNKFRDESTKELKPVLDIYYERNLNKKQLLAFNFVGTLFDTKSNYSYKETNSITTVTDIAHKINGKKYSGIFEGFYENTAKAGIFTFGIKQFINNVKNEYVDADENQISKFENYQTYIYSEWKGKLKKIDYGVGIGGTYISVNQDLNPNKDMKFTSSLHLGYSPKDNIKLRYLGSISSVPVPIAYLNDVEVKIDEYQLRRGNPILEPTNSYSNGMSISYNKKIWSMSLDLNDSYTPMPVVESIIIEGDDIIYQAINGDSRHNFSVSTFLRISPFDGRLTASLGYTYGCQEYKYPNHINILRNHIYRANVSTRINKFTLWGDIRTRNKNLLGEKIIYGEQHASMGIDYKKDGFSIGIGFQGRLSNDIWQYRTINESVSNNTKTYNDETKNMVYIKLSYNLNFGIKGQNNSKKIYNYDMDNAIF